VSAFAIGATGVFKIALPVHAMVSDTIVGLKRRLSLLSAFSDDIYALNQPSVQRAAHGLTSDMQSTLSQASGPGVANALALP
jgi:hypothetical protein